MKIKLPSLIRSLSQQSRERLLERVILFMFLFCVFCSSGYAQVVKSFSYTGTVQTFKVSGCVDTIHIKAWAAGGSGGGFDSYGGAVGGAGAFVKSDIAVTAGQILTIIVGGGAGPGGSGGGCCGGPSGWGNGIVSGGNGGNSGSSGGSGGGGGGGGASAIYNGSLALLVAGAGGGGSGGGQYSSGATGGGGGQNGNSSPGSCSSPGIAGASANGNGTIGANKGGDDGGGGGAGGGGYNGGSGGGVATGCDCGACGGGGGTSWSSGINTIIINGSGQTPGNSIDPDLPVGAAIGGGTSTKGGDGFIQLIFNVAPVAAFSNSSVCNGAATQFTNNTTNVSGTITSRTWDFGDGNPLSTILNPSHTYTNAGTYNVKLIENNSVGCADTITKPVKVYYNPMAGFTHTDVCLRDSMYFTNTSSVDPSTSIASYLWVFGDGSPTSNLKNPTHYYSAKGTYTVTLVTTTIDGCSNAAIVSVKTFDTPTSVFTFSNTCLANSAVFTNASTPPTMGTTVNWSWNFGDGAPLNTTVLSPQHLYTNPGNYQVTLITHSSNLGCPDTMQASITVYPMPVAKFSFTNVCLHQPMNFNDSSTVASGSISGWLWNYGDGTPLVPLQNPSHTYAIPNTYIVTLIVTTNNGCKDTITKSVMVHPLPVAQFSRANVCDGTNVQFNDLSTISVPDMIQLWSYSFGDGNSGITPSPSHLYAAAGSYSVKLLTVTNFGCRDSITKISIVHPNPVVKFTAHDTVGCEPLCVNFKDTSTISTGINAHWLWNVGDGSATHNSLAFIHCYTNDSVFAPNSFNVTLTVTSDSGCVTTKVKNNYITVYPNPVASFTVQPNTASIVNPVISITDLSTGTNFWHWNFGDHDTTSKQNPAPHTYADTGTYRITLITSTIYNCVDSAYQTIIIEPDFVFYIPNAFSPDGDGVNDTFSGKGIFIKDYEMMIYDRWGNLIFYTNDLNKGWDGTANHGTEIAQRDVYIYVVNLTDIRRKKDNYKGTVTLVR